MTKRGGDKLPPPFERENKNYNKDENESTNPTNRYSIFTLSNR